MSLPGGKYGGLHLALSTLTNEGFLSRCARASFYLIATRLAGLSYRYPAMAKLNTFVWSTVRHRLVSRRIGLRFLGCEPRLRFRYYMEDFADSEGISRERLKHPHHPEKSLTTRHNRTSIELQVWSLSHEFIAYRSNLVCPWRGGHFCEVQQEVHSILQVGITF